MADAVFVADLHGRRVKYEKLFALVSRELPAGVFLGGDLFPHEFASLDGAEGKHSDFLVDVLIAGLRRVREKLSAAYPRVFVILGNDDLKVEESVMREAEGEGLWEYMHMKRTDWEGRTVYGYANVPPTPFRLKDWERYDVSRFVDPGCMAPEEGWHSTTVNKREIQMGTIQKDLEALTGEEELGKSVFLFHSPPYQTLLDRADLDGRMVDHVPVDVHVGSIAIRRFIEKRQPLLTLHGHVHESARITGSWRDKIGVTHMFSAAHDGSQLALVRFDLDFPGSAMRELI
jgi:Icc-related predicted phosphoesterase